MKLGSVTKQPGERVSISISYTDALDAGDEVTLVESCTVDPAGVLTASPSLVSTDRVRVWIDGGEDGVIYKITVTISTAGGERLEDEVFFKVRAV
ncbi:hypothetical protein [Thauera aromatica]|uniref:phage fiber-tail adaptor protein n=1 Tax=Thauera aromatica TaxID=59405 RepID=UPI001FFDACB2|nr:hypothetical protein [Thauera aromatica]MCK2097519.1 hypothetical protein [Thauera aromatica]